MPLADFLAKEGVTQGKYGTASYRALTWSMTQPVEWEERADRNESTVIRKMVTKVLVLRYEVDFIDDGEKDDE